MKRKLQTALLILIVAIMYSANSYAESNRYGNPFPVEVTAYCDNGITASGSHTRTGICAAKKEWIGYTAIIYNSDMELVGIYQIEDTGSDYRLKNGSCIDIWLPDYDSCIKWGRQKCYVQIVPAEG